MDKNARFVETVPLAAAAHPGSAYSSSKRPLRRRFPVWRRNPKAHGHSGRILPPYSSSGAKNPTGKPPVGFSMLWQHRIIRQGSSARDFVPVQSSENAGILYYFPFLELRNWCKISAEIRRRNCAVLPYITCTAPQRLRQCAPR